MRIAIDMTLLSLEKEPGGMLFASRALLAGLAQLNQSNEYIILTCRPGIDSSVSEAPNMREYVVEFPSLRATAIQHQLILPRLLRRLQPDILHIPAFAAPIGWRGSMVVTIHDLEFLQRSGRSSLYMSLYYKYLLRESVRRAQLVIAVSEQTRQELISYWSIEPERIRVVHNAVRPSLRYEHISTEEKAAMRRRFGERYLLHVGRIISRKNVEVLVEAFNLLARRFEDLRLVLTGGVGENNTGILEQIDASAYRERITLAGWVPDQDLGPLYASATALIIPSRHEGFGLPTLEAMLCGTPVVASPQAASSEIAGEAVVRADCTSPPPLAEAIARLLTHEELRMQLIQKGREHAQLFTSIRCASATLKACEEVMYGKRSKESPMTPDEPIGIYS